MGRMIVKQPNGKYCRFSTVVDCPTVINMTEEEYIQLRIHEAIDEAIKDAKDTLKHYVHTMDEMDKSFRNTNMTKKKYEQLKEEMKDENGEMKYT
jgi:flagellar biosynthesis chaperone FliJ